jgi:hypothetical protein
MPNSSRADRLKRLKVAIVDASERLEEADERYQAIKPERSQVLNWRLRDAGLVSRSSNKHYALLYPGIEVIFRTAAIYGWIRFRESTRGNRSRLC